jgi:hypothetical protein
MRAIRVMTVQLAALLALLLLPAAALAAPTPQDKDIATLTFTAAQAGEGKLAVTALAPGTDWGTAGRESAVVTVTLDGAYNQDLVLFMGERQFTYQVALGPLGAGQHSVQVAFNPEKSPAGALKAKVKGLAAAVVAGGGDAALVARYSPVLYGRDLPEIAGRYENNYTDVPLLMYHALSRDAAGNTTIEYTVIWSNEDGGTNTPALMARWGRTTDIEWIYRVTLDPAGQRVAGVYQSPGHGTQPFGGAYVGDHPLLVTATANNNTEQVLDPAASTGYRFFMDGAQVLPAGRAREVLMDANPWSYPITAREMLREGKIEPVASPATTTVSDERNYLFLEIDKDTAPPPPPGTWIGTAVAVKLKGDPTRYTSNHNVPDWSIQRDIPAATTVELPPGTTAADIESISAFAVPVDSNPNDGVPPPANYQITVTAINRAFFLSADYLPGASFIDWHGSVVLTPQRPEAVIWPAP